MADALTPEAAAPAVLKPPAAYNLTLPGKKAVRVTVMPDYGLHTWEESKTEKDPKTNEDVVTSVTKSEPFPELCSGCKDNKVSPIWYRDSPGFCFCWSCVEAHGTPAV